jgi:hypothetical protein
MPLRRIHARRDFRLEGAAREHDGQVVMVVTANERDRSYVVPLLRVHAVDVPVANAVAYLTPEVKMRVVPHQYKQLEATTTTTKNKTRLSAVGSPNATPRIPNTRRTSRT